MRIYLGLGLFMIELRDHLGYLHNGETVSPALVKALRKYSEKGDLLVVYGD
jgi:hypothetical protein